MRYFDGYSKGYTEAFPRMINLPFLSSIQPVFCAKLGIAICKWNTKCSAELILMLYIILLFSVWQFGEKKNKKLQLHQQMSVSSSVHLSTIQKVSKWVYKFDISPVSQSTIQTVSLPVINQATQLINQTLFHQWINCSNSVTVPFKSKLTVCCKSWFSTQFTILDSCPNRESRIKN